MGYGKTFWGFLKVHILEVRLRDRFGNHEIYRACRVEISLYDFNSDDLI
jgi:hypothetical protein